MVRPANLYIALLTFGGVLLAASGARADEATHVRMNWTSEAGCADHITLAAALEDILRRDPFVTREEQADLTITGRAQASGADWTARIEIRDRHGGLIGERVLLRPGLSCDVLNGPIQVVIALIIDSARPSLTLHLPAVVEPNATEPAVTMPAAALGLRASLGVASVPGLLPGHAVGVRLEAGVLIASRWQPRMSLSLWPRRGDRRQGPGASYEMWLIGAGLCADIWRTTRFRFDSCVEGQAGVITASGMGAAVTAQSGLPQVQIGLELGSALRLGGASLRLSVGATALVTRPRFFFQVGADEAVIHKAWPISPTLSLAVGFGVRD